MTIATVKKYLPRKKSGTFPEYLFWLLEDVRSDLIEKDPTFNPASSFTDVLKIIEDGSRDYFVDHEDFHIDLSEAQKVVKDYRIKSEGCPSCVDYVDDSRGSYCAKFETLKNVSRTMEMSPRVMQYHSVGCDIIDRKLPKLESLLSSEK